MASSRAKRVVVTGFGALCPLGNGALHSWKRLLAGESALTNITPNCMPTNSQIFASHTYNLTYANSIQNIQILIDVKSIFQWHDIRRRLEAAQSGLRTRAGGPGARAVWSGASGTRKASARPIAHDSVRTACGCWGAACRSLEADVRSWKRALWYSGSFNTRVQTRYSLFDSIAVTVAKCECNQYSVLPVPLILNLYLFVLFKYLLFCSF